MALPAAFLWRFCANFFLIGEGVGQTRPLAWPPQFLRFLWISVEVVFPAKQAHMICSAFWSIFEEVLPRTPSKSGPSQYFSLVQKALQGPLSETLFIRGWLKQCEHCHRRLFRVNTHRRCPTQRPWKNLSLSLIFLSLSLSLSLISLCLISLWSLSVWSLSDLSDLSELSLSHLSLSLSLSLSFDLSVSFSLSDLFLISLYISCSLSLSLSLSLSFSLSVVCIYTYTLQ